jgi:hypothetical protein
MYHEVKDHSVLPGRVVQAVKAVEPSKGVVGGSRSQHGWIDGGQKVSRFLYRAVGPGLITCCK